MLNVIPKNETLPTSEDSSFINRPVFSRFCLFQFLYKVSFFKIFPSTQMFVLNIDVLICMWEPVWINSNRPRCNSEIFQPRQGSAVKPLFVKCVLTIYQGSVFFLLFLQALSMTVNKFSNWNKHSVIIQIFLALGAD